ncbi:RHS repeat protein [Pseudomonas agarici]|uniref:RHS repeat domain-containing protein n=3 Tax=Pseudomonas agarici TaxID=46677 RepID=UPI0008C4AB7A|nr:RHS repeat-associated core domain-containing protein [Pseudomonas agarici]NWC10317.1 RHS repeat protein [Pseudomonas agarici]SEK21012.1 insecticidal toxin complex protein TccC [Pseudomonas agarici]
MSGLMVDIHTHTPTLTVIDPRGLAVRSVAYCRSVEMTQAEERVNRNAYDAMGRLVRQWDPRLWALSADDAATPANLINCQSLSGKVLGSSSVDAGERINLFGEGDQLMRTWDGRGTERRIEYDDLRRPLAISEQGAGQAARCTERYEYADAGTDFAAHNQCGQLIRHDDPAGTRTLDEYALTGQVLEQTQRFLSVLDTPDWPPELLARDALLEPLEQAATTRSGCNPLGDVLEQVDAKGNRQLFDYTVAGQLLASHLQLSGQATPRTLVSAIRYSAGGQVEQETAGNDVVSTLTYRPEDGRLIRLQARYGNEVTHQDLQYAYDAVGNVLSIEDAALPIRYFANQRVEPVQRYGYDSLYRLIRATGWEAGGASRGPGLDRFEDPRAIANYQQTYRYDAADNLLELIHVGPQSHSRKLTAARYSNRCLPERNGRPPTEDEIGAAFDDSGNLQELQPGQTMTWDLRNQLREVRPVQRDGAEADRELYLYGGDGMRRRKIRSAQAHARSLISEVRYLPGLEVRSHTGTGEVLQVISLQAGRNSVRVLHWETAPPCAITNDQYRYNLADHLGSSNLELDGEAEVISQETYHPYGGTAWFAGRGDVEASYKTVRYSGKERDATGLYYYGFRYYMPWRQRWLNPDPAGNIDGFNRYQFVQNNPVMLSDAAGLVGKRWNKAMEGARLNLANDANFNGFDENKSPRYSFPTSQIITHRGLLSINRSSPQAGKTIAAAIMRAHTMLDNAVAALSAENQEFYEYPGSEILHNFTGSEQRPTAGFGGGLLEHLRDQAYTVNPARIVGFEASGRRDNAYVYKGDADKTLYINMSSSVLEDSERLAVTLIHEWSHQYLKTKDYWYMNKGNISRHEDIWTYLDLKMQAYDIVKNGPSEGQVKNLPVGFSNKQTFVNAFNRDPVVRQLAMTDNADNIALLVYALNHEYERVNAPPPTLFGRIRSWLGG